MGVPHDVEIFVGFDPREVLAYHVAVRSIARFSPMRPVRAISMEPLRQLGFYRRPTERHGNIMIDTVSGAPMSTEFANARFFVPVMSRARWALFIDCDVMLRAPVEQLLAHADERYAVQVVKHDHQPTETVKMDGQRQLAYPRKNWSSCVLWNLRHAGNQCYRLSLEDLNTKPGLWLHQFSWLKDAEIGELPLEWNWLEGVGGTSGDPAVDPKMVHYTRGTPDLPGYGDSAYADEWFRLLTVEEHMEFERRRLAAAA